MRPATSAPISNTVAPAAARAVGVRRRGRLGSARVRALEAWAHQRTQAGQRLDPAAAAAAGLVPTPVVAAQVLTRWLVRQLRRRDAVVEAGVLVDAGVLDYAPVADRGRQARWLLRLVDVDHDTQTSSPGAGERDPRPLGAGDFTAAFDPAHAGAGKTIRARPSRARERSPRVVAAAIPAGSRRAPDRTAFLDALRAAPSFAHRRGDFVSNLAEFAGELSKMTDWEDTRCTSPTWARLQELTGKSPASIHRYLTALNAAGLLGFVAPGQAAHTITNKTDAEGNLAGVYVLCTPIEPMPVDVSENPPPEGLRKDPTHSARDSQTQPAPLRGLANSATRSGPSCSIVPGSPLRPAGTPWSPTNGQDKPAAQAGGHVKAFGGGSGEPSDRQDDQQRVRRAHRQQVTQRFVELIDAGWHVPDLLDGLTAPAGATPPRPGTTGIDTSDQRWTRGNRGAARLAVAHLLRRNIPALRPLSTPDVAVVVQDFVTAGWTARDLHHALDHHPTTGPHRVGPPPPADGPAHRSTARLRGWLQWRLGLWRDPSGEPMRSRTQRAAAARSDAAARSAARDQAREQSRLRRAGAESPISQQLRARAHADADRIRAQREQPWQ